MESENTTNHAVSTLNDNHHSPPPKDSLRIPRFHFRRPVQHQQEPSESLPPLVDDDGNRTREGEIQLEKRVELLAKKDKCSNSALYPHSRDETFFIELNEHLSKILSDKEDDNQCFISLAEYLSVASSMSSINASYGKCFSVSLFLELSSVNGMVDCSLLYSFFMQLAIKNCIMMDMLHFCSSPDRITRKELERYLQHCSSTMWGSSCEGEVTDAFLSLFVQVASARFHFFLDPCNVGFISLDRLFASSVYEEFRVFVSPPPDGADDRDASTLLDTSVAGQLGGGGGGMYDEPMTPESSFVIPTTGAQTANWFAPDHISGVIRQFVDMVKEDHGASLEKDDLYKFRRDLNPAFVDALFQSRPLKDGGLALEEFIYLKMALENAGTPASMRYFFRIVDREAKGYLEPFDVHGFLRAYQDDPDAVPDEAKWSTFELFDMVSPKNARRITLKDLMKSNYPVTFLGALMDRSKYLVFINGEGFNANRTKRVVVSVGTATGRMGEYFGSKRVIDGS